jgi:guanylate kinase
VTGRLFVISGPSGVGKGTLIGLVREHLPELELAVSATTRPQRPGELDGREYHFLDPAEFQRRVKQGAFLEQVTFAGHRYGTLRSEVEQRLADGRSVVLEIDVPGAREIKRQMPDAVLVFISPPSLAEGSFEGFAPPLVESRSKNFLTMSLEEIAQGKLEVTSPAD